MANPLNINPLDQPGRSSEPLSPIPAPGRNKPKTRNLVSQTILNTFSPNPLLGTALNRTGLIDRAKDVAKNFTPAPGQNPLDFGVEAGKQVPQQFAKIVGQPQLRAYAALQRLAGLNLTPQGQFQEDLYGTNKPLTLTRAGREMLGLDPDIDPKTEFGKIALPVVGVAAAGLDLIPGGQVPKNAIRALATETRDLGKVLRIMKDIGITEEVANRFAPNILKVTDEKDVADMIATISDINEVKKATTPPNQKAVYGGETELSTKILEKLKGRSTVSKQFISDLTNSPDLKQTERDLIRSILNDEADEVNVPEFAEKVRAELLPLKRKGVGQTDSPSSLGSRRTGYENISLPGELRGPVENYSEHVYESPVKTNAGGVHFPGESDSYFGHTRVEDLPDNGTRRVIEVQSDLFQKGRFEEEVESRNSIGTYGISEVGDKYVIRNADGDFEDVFDTKVEAQKALDEIQLPAREQLKPLEPYKNNAAHFRMIREEVKQAAIDGKTKLQFPTGETAMKIEGLGDNTQWYRRMSRDEGGEVDLEASPLLKEKDLVPGASINQSGDQDWIITDVLGDGKFKAVPKEKLDDGMQRGKQFQFSDKLGENEQAVWDRIKFNYEEAFDISGKVDTNNPIYKFYEKDVGKYLRNKYDAKVVTDPQGVKWYEVDVKPEYAKTPVEAFAGGAAGFGEDEDGKATFNPLLAMAGVIGVGILGKQALKALRFVKPPAADFAALDAGPDGKSWSSLVKGYVRGLTPKKKAGFFDYVSTPEFVLEKLGLARGAELLQDAKDIYRVNKKEALDKVIAWKEAVEKGGKPYSSTRIFRYLDGDARYAKGEMTDKELEVAKEVKSYLKEWADRLNLPEDNRLSNYITHIFDKEAVDLPGESAFNDPDLNLIMQTTPARSVYNPFLEKRMNKPGYKEDVWGALDAYVKRATRKEAMDPALEQISDMARKLDGSAYEYVTELTHRINMRPTKFDELLDNTIKEVAGNRFTQRPTAYLSRKIRQMFYRGTLGGNVSSALRNLSQGANTYAKLGERYTAVGYTKLFSRLVTRNLDELYAEGILDDGFIQDKKMGVYKTFLEKLDPYLFAMFDMAEKINRGAAYYGAKSQALNKGLPEDQAVKYAKRIVRETQFAFGDVDTGVLLASDVLKTAFQLQSYNVKQTEFLMRMLKNKEFAGLFRWSAASLGFMYTIGTLFGMKPEQLVPTFSITNSPIGSLTSGMTQMMLGFSDEKKEEGKKSVQRTATAMVPGGAQIKKTIQGLKAYNAGKDVTAAGNTRFNIPKNTENFLRATLFGKSSLKEAQEYYDKLDSLNEKKPTKKKTKPASNPLN